MGEVLGDTLSPPQLPCREDSRETTTSLRHVLKPLLTWEPGTSPSTPLLSAQDLGYTCHTIGTAPLGKGSCERLALGCWHQPMQVSPMILLPDMQWHNLPLWNPASCPSSLHPGLAQAFPHPKFCPLPPPALPLMSLHTTPISEPCHPELHPQSATQIVSCLLSRGRVCPPPSDCSTFEGESSPFSLGGPWEEVAHFHRWH